MENKEFYSIFPEFGFEVFEEKIKKPMELYLQVNALNTVIANTMEKSKLGEASFYENDLFSSLALEEKICSDDILSPICDNYDDACDILNQPTESIPFEIPIGIIEKIMDERYAGDGTVHPSDHLLKLKELCGLFKVAGLSRENAMKKLFPLSLNAFLICLGLGKISGCGSLFSFGHKSFSKTSTQRKRNRMPQLHTSLHFHLTPIVMINGSSRRDLLLDSLQLKIR